MYINMYYLALLSRNRRSNTEVVSGTGFQGHTNGSMGWEIALLSHRAVRHWEVPTILYAE